MSLKHIRKTESIRDSLSYWSDAIIEFIEINEALINSYGDIRFFLGFLKLGRSGLL